MGYGIAGLLIFVLDILVIMRVLGTGGDPGEKLLWVILVLVLPLLGPILFFVVGPGSARA